MAIESDANRIFLEKNFNLELSEFGTTSSDLDNSGNTKISTVLSLDTMPYSNNSWLNDCINKNVKLKLIQILKDEILVLKQR